MTARERGVRETDVGTDGEGSTASAGTATADELQPARTISFESQGVPCEADLYVPHVGDPPWPTVVMAHVFGARRAWGLAPFAERFAGAGLAAFVFDYRYHGGSEGTPRRLVDPVRQLEDWVAALEHVRSLAVVDRDRLALWGASFSGGHALEVARREPDVRAVVAQVPFVDGRATVAHQTRGRSSLSRAHTAALAIADRALAVAGRGPISIPLVTEPRGGGLVDSPGAAAGFSALVPDETELVNRTPARVVCDLPFYRPGLRADEIDAPVHVVVAEEDRLLPPDPTEFVLDRLAEPRVHRVPGGHFDGFSDPWFEPVVTEQVAFLSDELSVDP